MMPFIYKVIYKISDIKPFAVFGKNENYFFLKFYLKHVKKYDKLSSNKQKQ